MKHAVITGAADGIGKAIALELLGRGYRVTGIDVDADRAQHLQHDHGDVLSFIIADLSHTEDVFQVANTLITGDPIDVLIHNAGISEVGHFERSNLARQQKVIDVNLLAPMQLTARLLSHKHFKAGASIVFVSSLSRYVSYPGASVYAATKDGIASYARSLSVAYPDLHVLTVYPGPTRTEHARRYSPDNSREDKRMLPSVLAEKVVNAIHKRQRILIPGAANWLFAILGRYVPALTDYAMRKSLLEKFDTQ